MSKLFKLILILVQEHLHTEKLNMLLCITPSWYRVFSYGRYTHMANQLVLILYFIVNQCLYYV